MDTGFKLNLRGGIMFRSVRVLMSKLNRMEV